VTIIDRPPIAVIAGPATGCRNTPPVTFDGSGSTDPDGTVVAWLWNFGDITTGSGAIVTHTYTTLGTFTVTLTVTDNSGKTGTTTSTITIIDCVVGGHASFDGYGARALYKKDRLSIHPTQTLLASAINDNTTVVTVYVHFKVIDGDGVTLNVDTAVVSLVPGQTVDGTINSTFAIDFNPSPGTFIVTATLFFSSTQSTTIGDPSFQVSDTKTFSFTAF
jgi:PKD repeat protein